MTIVSNRSIGLFCCLCLTYLLVAPLTPTTISAALKIAPILFLAFFTLKSGTDSIRLNLLFALLFSMGGDVLLEFGLFVPGLISFLLAQLLYGVIFLRFHASWSRNYLVSIAFLGFSLLMAYVMWNNAGDMRIPVITYLLVITFMGLSANTSKIRGVTLGAAIFILSDAIIAINRFVIQVPASDWLIMISYYFAQYYLASSILKKIEQRKQ